MKILYAIQGTGNGHISRARDIIPELQKYGELDLLISGTQADVSLSQPIKYNLHGFSFIFGTRGGINYWKTFKQIRLKSLYTGINHFPLDNYDLIINDFEPITAWAARLKKKPIVSLSHQCSFWSDKTPRPANTEKFGELILRNYAYCEHKMGFHFEAYDDYINTPIIRQDIREMEASNDGHYTVYLPAYDDVFIVEQLRTIKDVKWQVFSKHQKIPYINGNVEVYPVTHQAYNQSLKTCEGLFTGGGFEAPAEALFLGKKLLVVPMRGQYEQQCNAEALRRMGVPVIREFNHQSLADIQHWVSSSNLINVNFPDQTGMLIQKLVKQFAG